MSCNEDVIRHACSPNSHSCPPPSPAPFAVHRHPISGLNLPLVSLEYHDPSAALAALLAVGALREQPSPLLVNPGLIALRSLGPAAAVISITADYDPDGTAARQVRPGATGTAVLRCSSSTVPSPSLYSPTFLASH